MEELMADVFGGLAQGMAQGMGEIDKTVDYLEQIKQNRDNMRLRMSAEQRAWNQEGRAQDMHQYKMQEMEMQLAKLQDAETRRKMLDEIKGMHNGTRQGFSEELMNSSLYQRTFGNYNVRPASYFGQDVLASMGIENPEEYMLADNGYGEFIPIKKKIFDQTMGYQDELNKYMMADADLLSKQSKAMESGQIRQNMERFQELYDKVFAENQAIIDDPNATMEQKIKALNSVLELGSLNPASTGDKKMIPFASQVAEEQNGYLKEIRQGNFTNYDRSVSLANNTAEQAAVQAALLDGLKTKGIDFSKPINLEEALKGKEELMPYVNAYVQSVAQSKGAGEVIKNMTEIFGKGSDQYLDQIGEMLVTPGEKPSRDVIVATKKALLAYTPDGYFSNAKAGSKADEDLNTVIQLFINAYGNENFGSALTVGEEGRIDRAFGSNWQNTSSFLAGAIAKIRQTLGRMHDAARTNPQYANIVYGEKFIKLQQTLENLTKAREEIIEFGQYKQRNPQGNIKDFQAMKQSQTQAQAATIPTNAPATVPDDKKAAALKLFEGVDL